MKKNCFLYILLFSVLLAICIYYKNWWLLVIIVIVALIAAFINLFSVGLESGFRNKFPYDFLMHTGWVNQYFLDHGFLQVDHDISDPNYPLTLFQKDDLEVKVRLNAPLMSKEPYTISVLVNRDSKEWKFPIDADQEQIFNSLNEFFN